MDERAIKVELQEIKQRDGLTLTSIRARRSLMVALGLDSPEALHGLLVEDVDKRKGTREVPALRNAYGLDRDGAGSSLASRRRQPAVAWKVSFATIKRDEARRVNQLFIGLLPPDALAVRDEAWPALTSPIDINFGSSVSPDTRFRGHGIELTVHGADRSWFEVPEIALWFGEGLIESDRAITFFYLRPNETRPEATLQFQLDDQELLVNFKQREFHGDDLSTVRVSFDGPARPSTIVDRRIPDPEKFEPRKIKNLPSLHGMTNGSWMALLYDDRPTTSTVVVLRDFVEAWDDTRREDTIRAGELIPVFAPGTEPIALTE
ncbi:MAG TPA: hypothetical protein PLQ19_06585 [Aeromicrobium sp.]|nr:hypothetical protein [Aeromicrobium sp.]